MAGINAALRASGSDVREFDRTTSYLGVMIDDLVTKGISEPYRMFTSRAEFRLSLRTDNADLRLTPIGMQLGCVGAARIRHFDSRAKRIDEGRALLKSLKVSPSQAAHHGWSVNRDGVLRSAYELLAYPDLGLGELEAAWPELAALGPDVGGFLQTEARYAVYLDRQMSDVEALRRDENLRLSPDLDYGAIGGLSNEVRAKLAAGRPVSIGHAARMDGVTPAALTLLLAHVRRRAN
ncbi:MAG: hypothetical protein R3D02_07945 [Hyphomicrobiales bacterium]